MIAIAITLLALALPVPGGKLTNGQFLNAIRADWPDYFAFLISFVVIGNQWSTHRGVFRYVGRLTGWAGRLNMLWLLMMVLTPFAAKLLASGGALGVRFALYTLIQVIAETCLMLMSREAQCGRMLRPDAPESARRPDSVPLPCCHHHVPDVHSRGIRHELGLRAVVRDSADVPGTKAAHGTRAARDD